ncbi:MAG: transketolase, partial [Nitrospirae bacterium]
HVVVGVGDGGSTKGQSWEAANVASNLNLDNLILWCDFNNAQVMGKYEEVSGRMDLKGMYRLAGFNTYEADGHDFQQIHRAFSETIDSGAPSFILFRTKMGKGSPTMEQKDYKCHGVGFDSHNLEDAKKIILELGGDPEELEESVSNRHNIYPVKLGKQLRPEVLSIETGKRFIYTNEDVNAKEPRKAFGAALEDIERLNEGSPILIIGNDCDLGESTNINRLKRVVQHGIREHHAAVFSSALSILPDIISLFSTFGVFGTSEVYNQLRITNASKCNLKIFLTHVGISVGEDDFTHHCIDYIGLLRNLSDFILISVPDGNFTDAITRYAISKTGNFLVTMPRSPSQMITKIDGSPFYDENYTISPMHYDRIRSHKRANAAIIAHGVMVAKALEIYRILKNQGITLDVYAAPFVKNIDKEAIEDALSTKNVFIYEDHLRSTGLGSLIADAIMSDTKLRKEYRNIENWKIFGLEKLGPSGSYKD